MSQAMTAPRQRQQGLPVLQDALAVQHAEELAHLRQLVQRQAEHIALLEQSNIQDDLTGLLNRRGFNMMLEECLADYRRYGRVGALLLLDLNDFKHVNDTYGHQTGDALLQHVATLLKRYTRNSDHIARVGGDEFCVILKETTAEAARKKARELEALIANAVCEWQGQRLYLSASIGACAFSEADSQTELLERADTLMYHRKQQFHAASLQA